MYLRVDRTSLEKATKIKLLDVIINENLNWSDHICEIKNKNNTKYSYSMKIRRHILKYKLLMLYYTLVNPYLDYCNNV